MVGKPSLIRYWIREGLLVIRPIALSRVTNRELGRAGIFSLDIAWRPRQTEMEAWAQAAAAGRE